MKRESALRYGAYYFSRLLPHPLLRSGFIAAIRTCVTVMHGAAAAAEGGEAQSVLRTLRDAGVALITSPLNPEQVDDVLAYLKTAPVALGSHGQPVTVSSKGVSSAVYDAPTILACPHLLKAMNDPAILQIAAGFLGCNPTISGVGLRWSFADGGKADIEVQKFHRDTEDWKILRMFIYLTDVSDDSGPHQFVAESHKRMGRLRLKPYTDEQIDRQFGRERVKTIIGPKGTAFLGNMWGVHRGVPPSVRPRLLFNCTYTMTASPIYRYEPVTVADSHLYDAYTNRLLIR
ncbi:phytanoyl-CoA dioxygenase family protein [Hydrogenophaga sp. BPS33]|uniref:phytanoyl-CoA dioxygenase family protein n=1 Tax=Hydrogenophaga sp. BPS33 TaxID=2651974 RepID=UPI001357B6C2|nr:phytanoyl-CoA dioxygenase family protein [Hydrogenophaga sp. BPS33]